MKVITKIISLFLSIIILISQGLYSYYLAPAGGVDSVLVKNLQDDSSRGMEFSITLDGIKVFFYKNWFTMDKIRIEHDAKNPNIARIYPSAVKTRSCLKVEKDNDEIKIVFIDYRKQKKRPAYIGAFRKKIGRTNTCYLGSLENFTAGKRLVDLANGISTGKNRAQQVHALLQGIAKKKPFLKEQVKYEIFLGLFDFYFTKPVEMGITPVSIIRDRKENTRFFALVDELKPSNYIVGECDGDRIIILGKRKKEILTRKKMKGKGRISLNSFNAGRIFYRTMEYRRELKLLKVDKERNSHTYSETTFTKNITISLQPDQNINHERYWLTMSGGWLNRQIYPHYLIDLNVLESYKNSGRWPSTLDKIDQSKGKYIAFTYQKGWYLPEWLGIKTQKIYQYFYKVGKINENNVIYFVYRRVAKEDRITTVYIAEDQSTFTVEGLKINKMPVVFEADHIHLSGLLYLFLKYFKGQKDINISISKSLEKLIPTDISRYGHIKIPSMLSKRTFNKKTFWFLSNAKEYRWTPFRKDDPFIMGMQAHYVMIMAKRNILESL